MDADTVAEHAAPEDTAPELESTPNRLVELWHELEPVRTRLYPVVATVVALLVHRGVVEGAESLLWLALAAALLGIAGTEAARRAVDSPATVNAYGLAWQSFATDEYARGARDALHSTPDSIAARCRDVRAGRRCLLDLAHEGVHLIPTE